MNLKLFTVLFILSWPVLFSACSSAENTSLEEVVIVDKEVVIDDADLQGEATQINTSQKSTQEETRTLPDKSVIETLIDGFGNKTETRYFQDHPRLRFVILRTAANGTKVVTVYGYGSNTKTVYDLGDKALTASGDEIANFAKLAVTRSNSIPQNFMKKPKTAPPTPQPPPGSQFSTPGPETEQIKSKIQQEPGQNGENSVNQQNQITEDQINEDLSSK